MLLMLLEQTLSSSSSTCDDMAWSMQCFFCRLVFVSAFHHCNGPMILDKPTHMKCCYLHATSIVDWFIAMLTVTRVYV